MRLKQANLHDLVAEGRRETNTKGKQFKCLASQGLSLYAVMSVILHLFYMACPGEVSVYLALCDVIDCLSCFARGKITPETIKRCVHTFLQLFCDVFGFEYMTPKFHWLLHFGDYAKRFGMLVACYVHERKHKMVKRYPNDLHLLFDSPTYQIIYDMGTHAPMSCTNVLANKVVRFVIGSIIACSQNKRNPNNSNDTFIATH